MLRCTSRTLLGSMSPRQGISLCVQADAWRGMNASRPRRWPLSSGGPQKGITSTSRRTRLLNAWKLDNPVMISPCSSSTVMARSRICVPRRCARVARNSPGFQSYCSPSHFVWCEYLNMETEGVCVMSASRPWASMQQLANSRRVRGDLEAYRQWKGMPPQSSSTATQLTAYRLRMLFRAMKGCRHCRPIRTSYPSSVNGMMVSNDCRACHLRLRVLSLEMEISFSTAGTSAAAASSLRTSCHLSGSCRVFRLGSSASSATVA